GISREEMERRLDDILSFADIGDFVYQPVKTYSSGMFVRLAFACAINVEPDILIVDEALAVGDALFQAKCSIRMRKIIDQGVTLLFVSHDSNIVLSLCTTAYLMSKGKILLAGTAKEVCDYYFALLHVEKTKQLDSSQPATGNTKLDENASLSLNSFGMQQGWLVRAWIENSKNEQNKELEFREDYFLKFEILAKQDVQDVSIGYRIFRYDGIDITGTSTTIEIDEIISLRANTRYLCVFGVRNHLSPGHYLVCFGLEKIVDRNVHHAVIEANMAAVSLHVRPPKNKVKQPHSKTVPEVFTCHFSTVDEKQGIREEKVCP
ncbi:MAG: Wzt carbohydrate-binding domain-containing protein, partial [Patescibacteria group bacterium]|nr:Wzt carbohydrate-binding domain-containing protein [Patescibacteria group bacterium]